MNSYFLKEHRKRINVWIFLFYGLLEFCYLFLHLNNENSLNYLVYKKYVNNSIFPAIKGGRNIIIGGIRKIKSNVSVTLIVVGIQRDFYYELGYILISINNFCEIYFINIFVYLNNSIFLYKFKIVILIPYFLTSINLPLPSNPYLILKFLYFYENNMFWSFKSY